MPVVWLTYAWKDNTDQDIDHVVHELRAKGIDVKFDRVELLAGKRLWQQIDKALTTERLDAFIIYLTQNSLESEACQEELAYALDRALRKYDQHFSLIGLLPAPIERSLIPSAIATRKYVTLNNPNWADEILSGATGIQAVNIGAPPEKYKYKLHPHDGRQVLEVFPRSGRWYPFSVCILGHESDRIQNIFIGPQGCVPGYNGIGDHRTGFTCGELNGQTIRSQVDAQTSAYLFFKYLPSEVFFGQIPEGSQELTFGETFFRLRL